MGGIELKSPMNGASRPPGAIKNPAVMLVLTLYPGRGKFGRGYFYPDQGRKVSHKARFPAFFGIPGTPYLIIAFLPLGNYVVSPELPQPLKETRP